MILSGKAEKAFPRGGVAKNRGDRRSAPPVHLYSEVIDVHAEASSRECGDPRVAPLEKRNPRGG